MLKCQKLIKTQQTVRIFYLFFFSVDVRPRLIKKSFFPDQNQTREKKITKKPNRGTDYTLITLINCSYYIRILFINIVSVAKNNPHCVKRRKKNFFLLIKSKGKKFKSVETRRFYFHSRTFLIETHFG